MPFIPPVSVTRQRSVSVPALSVRGQTVSGTPSAGTICTAKSPRDDKPVSVKERLTSNLKQFGRKSQPRSRVTTGKSLAALRVEGRNPWLPSQRVTYTLPKGWSGGNSFLASSSGDSVPQRRSSGGHGFTRRSPEAPDQEPERKETRFTLTLTPEAVLLLQRRSAEKYRAIRNNSNITGELVDPIRRRRENNVAKRTPGPGARGITVPSNSVGVPGDISSMVKISLLNDRHKYDDVEYEEEEKELDERVVLKCTEWLRGLESAPVTLCTVDKSSSLKRV